MMIKLSNKNMQDGIQKVTNLTSLVDLEEIEKEIKISLMTMLLANNSAKSVALKSFGTKKLGMHMKTIVKLSHNMLLKPPTGKML